MLFLPTKLPSKYQYGTVLVPVPEQCIIKHLKNTKLYYVEFLRTEITSDPSKYHRECSLDGSYSLFQSEMSNVISVLKNSVKYSFVFFEGLPVALHRERKFISELWKIVNILL